MVKLPVFLQRYWQLNPDQVYNIQLGWDSAVTIASDEYKKRMVRPFGFFDEYIFLSCLSYLSTHLSLYLSINIIYMYILNTHIYIYT